MSWQSDLQFGARMLWRRPGTTLVTLGVLAVGIGLVAAIFSIADSMLWRPLDFPGSSQTVSLVDAGDQDLRWISFADYRHLGERQTTLEALTAYATFFNLVTPEGGASWGSVGAYVSSSFFDLLPISPALGRRFLAEDDRPGAQPVAIVSHRVWRSRLGGDPDALGASLVINGKATSLVGVMPAGVGFPYRHDLWLSLPQGEAARGSLMISARLRPGVSLDEARNELAHIGAGLDATRPLDGLRDRRWSLADFKSSTVPAPYKDHLRLLLLAVLGVLLVACLNVTNLRLVQSVERSQELSIRRALGAKGRRILGLLLAETSLLVISGSLAGLLLARGVLTLYRVYLLPSVPLRAYWIEARLDLRAVSVAAGAATLAALLGGLLPAVGALRAISSVSRARTGAALLSGPRHVWTHRGLVVVQIALAAALLVAAGLMLRTVWNLQRIDLGMESERVLVGRLQLHHLGLDVGDSLPLRERFFDGLLEALGESPEIESAALANGIPGGGRSGQVSFAVSPAERDAAEPPSARLLLVSPEYFDTLGMPLLSGRRFDELDGRENRIAIVDSKLAARRFAERSPVGRQLQVRTAEGWIDTTVVGVVAEVHTSILEPGQGTIFVPLEQDAARGGNAPLVLLHGRRGAGDLEAVLEEAVGRVDPRVAVHEIVALETLLSRQTWTHRTLRTLLVGFGFVTLLLAAAGLYAVLAFMVARRTHELGVRAALGADQNELRLLVLKESMVQVAVGLLLGTLLAVAVSRLLSSFLFGVESFDGSVLLAVILVLSLTGLLASSRPAAQAARITPVEALRHE